jgi:hypothetical protein
MYQLRKGLQSNLLDLLVDAPSSFAALYGGLVRHCGYSPGVDVAVVLDALLEMERREWVKAKQMADDGSFRVPTPTERNANLLAYQEWLPNADFKELSVDEVGLWYEITDDGRVEWKQRVDDDEKTGSHRWTLDDFSENQTLVIRAASLEVAQGILRWWLSKNPEVELENDSQDIQLGSEFTLHDGTAVADGIELSYRYRKQPSTH